MTLNHLSLFSGYEGFGDWAPIIRDIRTTDFRPMAGIVDVLTAGFPCQPHSVAGKQKGADDERNLWPDTFRAIGEVGPSWVLLENVPGILAKGYAGTVVGQLSEIGYDCKWGVVSAADVGANHRRARWWVLAYSTGHLGWWESQLRSRCALSPSPRATCEDVADAFNNGPHRPEGNEAQQGGDEPKDRIPVENGDEADARHSGDNRRAYECRVGQGAGASGEIERCRWWQVEPPLGRVVDGCPDRVGQLRALGNGIVPSVVKEFRRQLGI